MQEDVGRDNDLHSTVANRIVELAKHDQKKLTARQSGVAVIAVSCVYTGAHVRRTRVRANTTDDLNATREHVYQTLQSPVRGSSSTSGG